MRVNLIQTSEEVSRLGVRRHGQSTVRLALSYYVHTTKKTYTITSVPPQPHERQHRRLRPTIPKRSPRLSLSQKHEQSPQEIIVAAIDNQWIK